MFAATLIIISIDTLSSICTEFHSPTSLLRYLIKLRRKLIFLYMNMIHCNTTCHQKSSWSVINTDNVNPTPGIKPSCETWPIFHQNVIIIQWKCLLNLFLFDAILVRTSRKQPVVRLFHLCWIGIDNERFFVYFW